MVRETNEIADGHNAWISYIAAFIKNTAEIAENIAADVDEMDAEPHKSLGYSGLSDVFIPQHPRMRGMLT